MANAAAILLLLLIASAAAHTTTTMYKDEKCKREIKEMPQWQCVMWIASEPFGDAIAAPNRRYQPEEHLFSCCQHLNSLSSQCRCDAVWEMMMEITGYGDIACALAEQCGLKCSLTCPGSGHRGPALA
ncbi:2S sulfur-rich seed storage protein 1-like [Salvia splendens]|uniref:2S sulfur-rich seed storage protein 1-like n=1 Tax=Salvia splendens TaxID=180675 RepID=UPI001C274653|nr:2S sulfur-rich seed storage protein 1-like [Salvia splendens]